MSAPEERRTRLAKRLEARPGSSGSWTLADLRVLVDAAEADGYPPEARLHFERGMGGHGVARIDVLTPRPAPAEPPLEGPGTPISSPNPAAPPAGAQAALVTALEQHETGTCTGYGGPGEAVV